MKGNGELWSYALQTGWAHIFFYIYVSYYIYILKNEQNNNHYVLVTPLSYINCILNIIFVKINIINSTLDKTHWKHFRIASIYVIEFDSSLV